MLFAMREVPWSERFAITYVERMEACSSSNHTLGPEKTWRLEEVNVSRCVRMRMYKCDLAIEYMMSDMWCMNM